MSGPSHGVYKWNGCDWVNQAINRCQSVITAFNVWMWVIYGGSLGGKCGKRCCEWKVWLQSISDDLKIGRPNLFFKTLTPPLGILARNFHESSKILQCTFGNVPLSSKCTLHFRWSFIFSTYGLYFLPVSKSAEFFPKSAPWRILEGLGWLGLKQNGVFKTYVHFGLIV